MSLIRGTGNPFYVVLVATGTLFCVTACAYAGMTVQGIHGVEPGTLSSSGQWLHQTLDRHGVIIFGTELSALAIFAVAAIVTDRYWIRRQGTSTTTRQDDTITND